MNVPSSSAEGGTHEHKVCNERCNDGDSSQNSDVVTVNQNPVPAECEAMHQFMMKRARSSIIQPTANSTVGHKPQQPPGVPDCSPMESISIPTQVASGGAMEASGNDLPQAVCAAAIDCAIREQAGVAGVKDSFTAFVLLLI
jgi:hypothetical protein